MKSNRKSTFEIWWYYLSDEQKEVIRTVGAFIFTIILFILMVFAPYCMHEIGIINLTK